MHLLNLYLIKVGQTRKLSLECAIDLPLKKYWLTLYTDCFSLAYGTIYITLLFQISSIRLFY